MTRQEVLIENIDELWQVVNHTIDQPHISVVLSNLQWMSALRDKIQTQINKAEAEKGCPSHRMWTKPIE